jgi:hypothetical protein
MSVVCFDWIALVEKAVEKLICFRLLKKGPAFAEAASRRQADAS